MSRCARLALGLMMSLAMASCATRKGPAYEFAGATQVSPALVIAPGIPILARAALPPGFHPIPFHPPLWVRDGQGIAVAGTQDGGAMLIEFTDSLLRESRVLAADRGPQASAQAIADVALSPDTSAIAIARVRADGSHVDVVRRDLSSDRERPIASLDGKFDRVSLGWPDGDTIALAAPEPPSQTAAQASSAAAAKKPASVLYLSPADGSAPPNRIHLDCALSSLNWSPDGAYAVAQGAPGAPPVIVDRQRKTCAPFGVRGPIHVLGWSPKANAFLYAARLGPGPAIGTFQLDLASRRSVPIAVSSAAASYLEDGSILALGNEQLTLQLAVHRRRVPTTVEIALLDPTQARIGVEPLGVRTFSDMLASSTMVFSPQSMMAAIELFVPLGAAAVRYVIGYSPTTRKPLLIAQGAATGLLLMSWSPDGRELAILDGADPSGSELTIITPAAATPSTAEPPLVVPPGAESILPPTPSR